jgi:hypothetical protein
MDNVRAIGEIEVEGLVEREGWIRLIKSGRCLVAGRKDALADEHTPLQHTQYRR